MPDMLVKNYALPDTAALYREVRAQGIVLKRAIQPEMLRIMAFAEKHFGRGWASEVAGCFVNKPASCFIALDGKEIVGFSCCESTCRGYFGPTGVLESYRGRNIGRALLMMALEHMRDIGCAYHHRRRGPRALPEGVRGHGDPRQRAGIYKDMTDV